jgi:hypothetical protein
MVAAGERIQNDAAGSDTAALAAILQDLPADSVATALEPAAGHVAFHEATAEAPWQSKRRVREQRPKTAAVWRFCCKHQNALVAKKAHLRCTGEPHVRSFTRLCTVARAKGSWRKLKNSLGALPDDFSAEEKARLKDLLRLAFTKPMKGRWGSFNGPRERWLDIACATHDRHVVALLLGTALNKTLSAAFRYDQQDEEPGPIQEEEDQSKNLRLRVKHAYWDALEDFFWVEMAVSHICNEEVEHQFNWLQKVLEEDGTQVRHNLLLAAGKSEEWVRGTLDLLDTTLPQWRPLDRFLEQDGPVRADGTRPKPVPRSFAEQLIVNHTILIAMEIWRRFVVEFRKPPNYLSAFVLAPEDPDEASPTRRDAARKFLGECWVCLGFGPDNLRDIFYEQFEATAREGRIDEAWLDFWRDYFHDDSGYETQRVEGDNSKIKRHTWIARAIKLPRVSTKMVIGKSEELTFPDFMSYAPRVKEASKAKEFPFATTRYEAVEPVPIQRFPDFPCQHKMIGSPALREADIIAAWLDVHWQLGWIMGIGAEYYINCGFHYSQSGVGRLTVAPDVGMTPQGEIPDLLMDVSDLDYFFGDLWRLDKVVAFVLSKPLPAPLQVEVFRVKWTLSGTPARAAGSSASSRKVVCLLDHGTSARHKLEEERKRKEKAREKARERAEKRREEELRNPGAMKAARKPRSKKEPKKEEAKTEEEKEEEEAARLTPADARGVLGLADEFANGDALMGGFNASSGGRSRRRRPAKKRKRSSKAGKPPKKQKTTPLAQKSSSSASSSSSSSSSSAVAVAVAGVERDGAEQPSDSESSDESEYDAETAKTVRKNAVITAAVAIYREHRENEDPVAWVRLEEAEALAEAADQFDELTGEAQKPFLEEAVRRFTRTVQEMRTLGALNADDSGSSSSSGSARPGRGSTGPSEGGSSSSSASSSSSSSSGSSGDHKARGQVKVG